MGKRELEMGSMYLTELRSSNDIWEDTAALRERLREDGYLLIRGFHDRAKVQKARMAFLRNMHERGLLDDAAPVEEGLLKDGTKWGGLSGGTAEELENEFQPFLDVVNGPAVMGFFDRLLGEPSLTFDYKWLRSVGYGGNTGAHYDIVYMGRGSQNVYTMWTPFGDIPPDQGTLAMLLGSQHYEKIRKTYGKVDVDRDNAPGWFTEDPIEIVDKYGGQWATTAFEAGDAIIFGMFMMHGSLNNTTNHVRISSDTRYQPASEPTDERWVGRKPKKHLAQQSAPPKPIEQLRKEWGV
ncbi:phytanoyl-CoA dioxygenase [Paenibacillus montanisoli]|uniref:Phytanoyl-CoA dioxygenase n=2 Tax=Paenibacillus montanisoli TaxID=2081970 RepID=A0A328U462_9BACL|nr:phytanoyl-CoA dioxygenase [Paenibacillus montanisoli]